MARRAVRDTYAFETVGFDAEDEPIEVRRRITAGSPVPEGWRADNDADVEDAPPHSGTAYRPHQVATHTEEDVVGEKQTGEKTEPLTVTRKAGAELRPEDRQLVSVEDDESSSVHEDPAEEEKPTRTRRRSG